MSTRFELLREALKNELAIDGTTTASVLPILHNRHVLFLQFNGWSIDLHIDGTWTFGDTTGG